RRTPRMISPRTSASLASRSIDLFPGAAAREQLFSRRARAAGLDPRPKGLGYLFSSSQVGAHFIAMPKVVGDDGMDVSQRQGIVGPDEVFWRHAVLVLLDHQVEADARGADADSAL